MITILVGRQVQFLEQGLKDEIKFGKKEMSEAKKSLAGSGEKKAGAEADLAQVTKARTGELCILANPYSVL